MKRWIPIFVFVIVGGFWISKTYYKSIAPVEKSGAEKPVSQSYWTCPMHPQIHADHAGECPICHMKLVRVKAQEAVESEGARSSVQASSNELALIGVQETQVERMDLNVSIPVAGRFVSNSTVAFQLYESDVASIRPGLPFKGRGSFFPEDEIRGTISSVDSIVDPTSRTIRTLGRIEKATRGLIADTTFSGIIEVALKNRVAIPESAVLHTGTVDLVYIFGEHGKLFAREVRLGQKTEGFFEVVSGLEPGDVISSGPNFLIDSEAKIRGVSSKASAKGKSATPECPADQHWDFSMVMCMPGKAAE